MKQFGGKSNKISSGSKRHFRVVIGSKEHGLYVSSTPSSAARKAVTKLCSANKSKKVEFHIREITQGSKKKIYGPYMGYIEKLKEPIELKGRLIRYKPVAKLSGKISGKKQSGGEEHIPTITMNNINNDLIKKYYKKSPVNSYRDDNFDTDDKYSENWFHETKIKKLTGNNSNRLTAHEIVLGKYYIIRFKNNINSYNVYEFIGYTGTDHKKIIFKRAKWMHTNQFNPPFLIFDIDNIYLYDVTNK